MRELAVEVSRPVGGKEDQSMKKSWLSIFSILYLGLQLKKT